MSEATSLKQQTQENVRERVRYNRHQEEKSNIEENVFFSIIQDSSIEPEKKVEEIAKTLTFTNDKEKDRANIKAFEEFKEYISDKFVKYEPKNKIEILTYENVLNQLNA